jgi:hypothetical protein
MAQIQARKLEVKNVKANIKFLKVCHNIVNVTIQSD